MAIKRGLYGYKRGSVWVCRAIERGLYDYRKGLHGYGKGYVWPQKGLLYMVKKLGSIGDGCAGIELDRPKMSVSSHLGRTAHQIVELKLMGSVPVLVKASYSFFFRTVSRISCKPPALMQTVSLFFHQNLFHAVHKRKRNPQNKKRSRQNLKME